MIRSLARLAAVTLAAYSGYIAGRLTAQPDVELLRLHQNALFMNDRLIEANRALREKA